MSRSKQIEHELTLPDGPISLKYQDFVNNEDFKEMAFVGAFNTSKSSALVDWLILSGLNYPGANLVLTRAKLSDLRRTTLTKYLSRAGNVIVDDYNKNEAVIAFPEIDGQQSRLYLFGLDRHDLVEVLKSFEPFRAAVEESNEVPGEALDLLLGRCRQKVRHRTRTNAWMVKKMAYEWGVSEDRAQQVLGIDSTQMHEKHLGKTQLKHVFNPEGNDSAWKRVIGIPYPKKEEMGPEWVKKNVGIREFFVTYEQLGSYEYKAGNLVLLRDGSRAFTARELPGKNVELVDGQVVPKIDTTFVGQRAAIFAFMGENWSRNVDADENFLYMMDPAIREKYFEAKIDTKRGLLFPEFDPNVHVVPAPKREMPSHLTGIISIDHGLRHPTSALFGIAVTKPVGGVLILREYLVSGRSAFENAVQIKSMIPTHLSQVEYWGDPSMWRVESTSMRSVADEYYEAGLPITPADNNIDYSINLAKELMRIQDDYRSGEALPRLFISEECEQLIHALETATYKHMTTVRDNWIVDMVDALRYFSVGFYNTGVVAGTLSAQSKPRPAVWGW